MTQLVNVFKSCYIGDPFDFYKTKSFEDAEQIQGRVLQLPNQGLIIYQKRNEIVIVPGLKQGQITHELVHIFPVTMEWLLIADPEEDFPPMTLLIPHLVKTGVRSKTFKDKWNWRNTGLLLNLGTRKRRIVQVYHHDHTISRIVIT